MYTHFTVNHTHHKHHSGEQNIMPAPYQDGARRGAVGGDTALKAGRSRAQFLMVSLEFFFDIILLALGNSASNRNDYQEYFLGDKSGQCVGLTTLPIVLNLGASTSWNPQSNACTGIALPLLCFTMSRC
jgi:hypothetical protein